MGIHIRGEKVLYELKDDLNMIVDQPESTHDESFTTRMMDPWAEEFSFLPRVLVPQTETTED